MPSEDQDEHMSQAAQQQQRHHQHQETKFAANANTNQNSTITNDSAYVTNAFKEKKKTVRRAFSIPRNLFRLSRRNKMSDSATAVRISSPIATNTSTICNQSVQNSNEKTKLSTENADNNKHQTLPVSSLTGDMLSDSNSKQKHSIAKPQPEEDNNHRLFRRSTWKKFLFSRFIIQTINLKVIFVVFIYYNFGDGEFDWCSRRNTITKMHTT